MNAAPARVAAARALAAVSERGASLERVLPELDAALTDARDRALARAIVYAGLRGVFRYRAWLDALLARPLPRREHEARALLLCALAQLDQGIGPEYAVVDASVAAMRELGRPHFAALVNAVLRRFLRERDRLRAQAERCDETRFDHPRWMIDALRAAWPARWRELLAANNAPAPLWLRVNSRRTTRAALAARLAEAGIAATAHAELTDALRVDASHDVRQLPGFAAGEFSVQDGAAQLAVELLALAPGLRLLDACAAPGGKLAHALEREPALAGALALEREPERGAKIGATLARLGLTAELRIADATEPGSWWDGRRFDRILIDAPCSGTGVIRRHPDIRLHRRPSDLEPLAHSQDRLLDALWPLLAPGGRLVYATCSVLPVENQERIDAFLARTANARALACVPEWFGAPAGAGRQQLSGDDGLDGFFYAVLTPA